MRALSGRRFNGFSATRRRAASAGMSRNAWRTVNSAIVARAWVGMSADKHRQDEEEEKGGGRACRTVVNERLRAQEVLPFSLPPPSVLCALCLSSSFFYFGYENSQLAASTKRSFLRV